MFEVQDLRYATLATVSRCGMVWFSEDVLSSEMLFENYMLKLKNVPLEEGEEEPRRVGEGEQQELSASMQVREEMGRRMIVCLYVRERRCWGLNRERLAVIVCFYFYVNPRT